MPLLQLHSFKRLDFFSNSVKKSLLGLSCYFNSLIAMSNSIHWRSPSIGAIAMTSFIQTSFWYIVMKLQIHTPLPLPASFLPYPDPLTTAMSPVVIMSYPCPWEGPAALGSIMTTAENVRFSSTPFALPNPLSCVTRCTQAWRLLRWLPWLWCS